MKRILAFSPLSLCLMAFQCGAGGIPPASPGERVFYQDVYKEVPKPCPVTQPVRPAPLAKPLPSDLGILADVLTAKLEEWAGKGKYGDQAQAAIAICAKEPQ